jgi:hypothetical protein
MKNQDDYFLMEEEKIDIDSIEDKFSGKKTRNMQSIPTVNFYQIILFLKFNEFSLLALVDKKYFVACADFSKKLIAIQQFSQDYENIKAEAGKYFFNQISQKYHQLNMNNYPSLDEVIHNVINPATTRPFASFFTFDDDDVKETYVKTLKKINGGCCAFGVLGFLTSGGVLLGDITPTKVIICIGFGALTLIQCATLLTWAFCKDYCNVGEFLRKLAVDHYKMQVINELIMHKPKGDGKNNRIISDLITLTCIKQKRLPPLWKKVYQGISPGTAP